MKPGTTDVSKTVKTMIKTVSHYTNYEFITSSQHPDVTVILHNAKGEKLSVILGRDKCLLTVKLGKWMQCALHKNAQKSHINIKKYQFHVHII